MERRTIQNVLLATLIALGTLGVPSAMAQESTLRHFQCYEIRPSPRFAPIGVNLVDQFNSPGGAFVNVKKPRNVCVPANKNDEDPGAVADPQHLAGYRLSRPSPKFAKLFNQEIVNQFGTTFVDVVKPSELLVPSTKSLIGPPSPPDGDLDHFTCYKVRRARGTPKFQRIFGVKVEDQFFSSAGAAFVDIIKPKLLCAPTNKNGEDPGAEAGTAHLLCYKVRSVGGLDFLPVFVNNQFGEESYQLKRRKLFCVPSLKNP